MQEKTDSKTKYLFKNTAILFISNFSSKILIFFLLPLYTSVLTTAEYGISDLINTTVSILYIVLTFYIGSGILRFAIDQNENKNELLSLGLGAVAASFLFTVLISAVSRIFNLIPSMNGFYIYLCILYLFHSLNVVFSSFTKGREKIHLIGIAGVASTITQIGSNLLLLLVFKLGIHGYLISMLISNCAAILIYIFGGAFKNVRMIVPRVENIKRVIKYSAPIAATELGWLICTSSDKYVVAYMMGDSATGIISVAHRLPTILSAFTSIFIQAWTLSAFKEYGSKDKVRYYSKMFNYYNSFTVCIGALLIVLSKTLGSFLYRGDFAIAWIYTPIYITALVMNTNSSFSGSIISASKKTRSLFTTTVVGAFLNIFLDIVLIRYMGIFGAGIATAVSYIVISIMRISEVRKLYPITIEKSRFLTSYGFLILLTLTMIFSENSPQLILSIGLFVGTIALNFNKVKEIFSMLFLFIIQMLEKKTDA